MTFFSHQQGIQSIPQFVSPKSQRSTGSLQYDKIIQDMEKILLGDREITPVTPVDKRFACPLCGKLMQNPLQTDRGMVACTSCYEDRRREIGSEICPLDGEKIEHDSFTRLDKFMVREISKIQVQCFYEECKWKGALNDINRHEETDCQYARTECDICRQKVLKKQFAEHRAKDCTGNYDVEMEETFDTEETKMKPKFKCPSCGKEVESTNSHNHWKDCQGTKCPYEQFGCKNTYGRSAKEHEEHISNYHSYDHCVLEFVQGVLEENKNLDSKIMQMTRDKQTMDRKFSSLHNDYQILQNKCKELLEKSQKKDRDINLLESKFQKLYNVVSDLEQNQYEKKESELKNIVGNLSTKGNALFDITKLSESEELIRKVESDQAMLSANLADTNLKVKLLEHRSTNGTLIYRLENFTHRLEQARQGKIFALHSPPCFTSPNGYKFCLRVYLNGDGMGQGTHISIYFVLMRNHYDNLLEWPFQKKISIRMINHKSRQNDKRETFNTDKTSTSFRKPDKEMNMAAGCPKFLDLSSLLNGGYLADDSIFIEVKVEDPVKR